MAEVFACELLEAYRADLLRYFSRRGCDHEAIEDATQAVGAKWSACATIVDDEAAPWAYMRASVARALAAQRRLARDLVSLDSVGADGDELSKLEQIADPGQSLEELAVGSDLADVLAQAAASLPAAEQRIVARLASGLTISQIGRVEGCTRAVAARLIRRARHALAQRLPADLLAVW